MATQRELEKFEGELARKYPPSPSGESKKMDFYIQPVDGERIRIGVWESDQIAYAVAQAMTEGDQLTVMATRNVNKTDASKFYLNAKDIIVTSAPTSGQKETVVLADQQWGQEHPKATPSGYIPSSGDQWRADGMETGNAKTNATSLVVAYYNSTGKFPSDEWIEEAAERVNALAMAIRLNVEPVIVETETTEEGVEVTIA